MPRLKQYHLTPLLWAIILALLPLLLLAGVRLPAEPKYVIFDGPPDFVIHMADAVGFIHDTDPEMFAWMESNEVRILHWENSPYPVATGYISETRTVFIGRGVYGSYQENAHWIAVVVTLMRGDIDQLWPQSMQDWIALR